MNSAKHNADADQASKGSDNKVRTGQTTNGHERGSSDAADPDARRTRATHSLAGKHACAAHELNGHCPRRSNLLSSTLALTRRKNLCLSGLGRQLERLAPGKAFQRRRHGPLLGGESRGRRPGHRGRRGGRGGGRWRAGGAREALVQQPTKQHGRPFWRGVCTQYRKVARPSRRRPRQVRPRRLSR